MTTLIGSGNAREMALGLVAGATLALAAAALADRVLKKSSASARHLAWTAAVVAILVLPALMLAMPGHRLAILPTPAATTTAIAEPPVAPAWSHSGLSIQPTSDGTMSPVARFKRVAALSAPAPREVPAARARSRPAPGSGVGAMFAALWAVGAIVVGLPRLVARIRLSRLRRRWLPEINGAWTDLAGRLGTDLGLARTVPILRGPRDVSPMTWGTLRPVVLMPASADDWPDERLRAVLLHELAHVRRRDCLIETLAGLACALYWFHPLAWLAAYRLRVEREIACDDLVLGTGPAPSTYAGYLLAVARESRPTRGLTALAMARPSRIEGRLQAILDASRARRPVGRRGVGLVLATAVAVVIPLASVRLSVREATAGTTRSAEDDGTMTVRGRVLDPDGRPVAKAAVAVVARRKLATLNVRSDDQHVALGRATTDPNGRFALDVPRTSSVRHYEAKVLAVAPGFGLGWIEIDRDAESPTAEVALRPERVVEGRLVDLQGAPAANTVARVSGLGVPKPEVGGYDGLNFWKATPDDLDGIWPADVTTDADGRFRLAGIGRDVRVSLRVDDSRYAQQGLSVDGDVAGEPKRVTLSLRPAFAVTGRVTAADTGAPIRDAIVTVATGSAPFLSGGESFRTDADGRYAANVAPGARLLVTAYPPAGSPYLIFGRHLDGNDGLARREVDLVIPRGVLVTGTITAEGGKPLAGAGIFYGGGNVIEEEGTIGGWMAAVTSGPDGRYAIAVPPGKGHLFVYGPTADFVHVASSSRELQGKPPGGRRLYAHAFLPYKADRDPLGLDVTLIPGATVRGQVVGPDGAPVAAAEIVTTLSISPFHTTWRGDFTIPVRAGRFALHGVPTDHKVKCSFFDAKNGLGATIAVDAATTAPVVRLEPCGTARARLVDGKGRPVAGAGLHLNIVGTPGIGDDFGGKSLDAEERTMLEADAEIYANVDRLHYWQGPRSDAEGRITLPYLIPGATYRITVFAPERDPEAYRWRDFTVGSGQTLDLGDVLVKTAGMTP